MAHSLKFPIGITPEMKKNLDAIANLLRRPAYRSPNYEFSDSLIETQASKLKFHDFALDRNNLKTILVRFYNFYLYGTIATGDNSASVVIDAISIGRTLNSTLWNNCESYGPEGFYNINKSTPTELNLSHSDSFVTKQFSNFMQKGIAKIDPKTAASAEEDEILKLTGFLALTLFRAAVKNEKQMKYAFRSVEYKDTLHRVVNWPKSNPFCSPCDKCIEDSVVKLSKSLQTTNDLFTIVLDSFRVSHKKESLNEEKLDFLLSSVLTDTAYNGLGVLRMLEKTCKLLNINWMELKKLNISRAQESFIDIEKFYEHQKEHEKENPQLCYKWARIVNQSYFSNLNCQDHDFLSVMLATILNEPLGNWKRDLGTFFDHAEHYGRIIRDKYYKN